LRSLAVANKTKPQLSVLPDRLKRFLRPDFRLRSGTGAGINVEADVCLMQAVGWLAGETGFGDAPDCACPVIRAYAISLNDSRLFAHHRDDLKPFAAKIVGTRNGPASEIMRALIACDYSVRVLSPILLRSAGREDWAVELESLSPITELVSAAASKLATERIRDAAFAAAWAAAWDATGDAARSAAWAAAWDATGAAARAAAMAAARDAARAAAGAAARDAARSAAWAAAGAAAGAAAWAAAGAAIRAKSLECLDAMIAL
jgi:hypothetical protein